ncbi:hypothetical protein [Pseudomonas sp. PSPC3-3]|uniref:hypothetical protein n=1 Tax=unclassified Pseudomonas TaxID=196821 RepID=UPI003CF3C02A
MNDMNELAELLENRYQGRVTNQDLKRIVFLRERAFWLGTFWVLIKIVLGLAAICALAVFALRYFVADLQWPWLTWQYAGLAGAALAFGIWCMGFVTRRRLFLQQMKDADLRVRLREN